MNALWSLARKLLFRPTPACCHAWRIWLLNRFGARVSYQAKIAPSVLVHQPANLRIEPGARLMGHVIVDCGAAVTIGHGALLSRYVHLCASERGAMEPGLTADKLSIRVGAGVWIATDTFVGPGTEIGDSTVVGARSVVRESLPAGVIAFGTPARPVRPRPLAQP